MSEALEEYRRQAGYRRGTVMGLTAAEAFMLIAFILLMLLVLGRVTADEERRRLVEENTALTEIVDRLGSEESVARAIAFHRRFEDQDPDVMEARLALLEDGEMQSLIERVRELPLDGLRELTDMVRTDAFPGAQEKVEAVDRSGLRPAELLETGKEIQELREALEAEQGLVVELKNELDRIGQELSAAQDAEMSLHAELAAFSAIGVTPEDVTDMQAALNKIDARRRLSARTGAEIAATISERAGDRIAALGGRILPDGDVIFPDAVLFDAGRADIRPEFDQLLQSFCRLWFETLHEQRDVLDTMQVEGHASSEFGDLEPESAFVENLLLSQRRAAAVFGRCLAYAGDDAVTDWARGAMAAIGYSSSRAIIENGIENRSASRRVVFALKPKSETEMADSILQADPGLANGEAPELALGSLVDDDKAKLVPRVFDLEAGVLPNGKVPGVSFYRDAGYHEIVGQVSLVRDGDTIVVGDQPIRLEGVHAPETDTALGLRARDFMTKLVVGRSATCLLSGEQTYDRRVGVCFVDGRDIAAELISAGMGLDCPAFSRGRYVPLETTVALREADLPGYCKIQ